jgi:hypothetical protein
LTNLEENKMLDKLSPQQVEQALAWLASPVQEAPPDELLDLNQMEWFLLDRMLQTLMQERDSQRVH